VGEIEESVSAVEAVTLNALERTAMDSESPWRSSLHSCAVIAPAMIALGVLLFMVVVTLLAPLYAHDIAHDNPFASNLPGPHQDRQPLPQRDAGNTQGLGLGVTPIGPTWDFSKYFLGLTNSGATSSHGCSTAGRVTLLIGFSSGLICIVVATVLGMLAATSAARRTGLSRDSSTSCGRSDLTCWRSRSP